MFIRALSIWMLLAAGSNASAQTDERAAPPVDTRQSAVSRSVICGTQVVQANPGIDPKMAKAAPSGQFIIRDVEPRVCRNTFLESSTAVKQRLPQFFGPRR
jgi:hypothetical protein